MRRVFLALALMFMVTLTMNANPVDLSLAQTAALKFFENQYNGNLREGILELVLAEPNGAYYVFNTGANGFIIIAGDDSHRPVIGYSNESTFDANNIPPSLVDYLGGIAENILRLKSRGNASASPMVAAEWESLLNHGQLISRNGGRAVDYLCQTKWDQYDPYNYCCPEDPAGSGGHAIVGCLATAMSQLMRFWAMPTQGIGSHCYIHEAYGEICADFGTTTYDWEHMPNVLSSDASEAEKVAVGTLCFHCGVAIDMGYGPDGSGGASAPIPSVMHNYFDYSEANVQRNRNDYETETWKRMVREQFDMGWPMYYGGCQSDGCHAFVCDGYDDYDLFHFNLGWGGGSDGWYLIDDAPYTSPADAMFNFIPSAIYNITPSAPTDFSVDVPVDSELRTVLHWTNPTTSLDGTPLTSIEEVVVMRDNQVIRVLSDVSPGETVVIEDTDLPIYDVYQYTVYVKANGRYGKHAYALDVLVGPTCQWKVVMTTNNSQGWEGGYVSAYNNAGHEVARCTMNSPVPALEKPLLPLGYLSFGWTAPEDTVGTMSFTIKDANENVLFSFSGSSSDLESGIFLTTNNSCFGESPCAIPENLEAVPNDDYILLTWDPVENEGYGYNIYRDGLLYRIIPAGTVTSFLDEQVSIGGHCYQMTVLCEGGESETKSNETCSAVGPCYPPRNLDYELTSSFKIKLTWEPPVPNDGLTGYVLYRKQGGGEYERIKMINPTDLSYTDRNLSAEDDYYYRLYAYYQAVDCYSSPANYKYDSNVFELHAYYSPTGLEEAESQVNVYPNPSHGSVRVEAPAMTRVSVYNTLGQLVLDEALTGDSFEWHDVAKGLFLMRIQTENGVFYTKIIAL